MISPRIKAYILLLIVSAIWGIATPIIKYALAEIDALTFLTYRFGISASIAIFLVVLMGWNLPKSKRTLAELLIYSFLTSTVALGLLFFGLENTTVLDSTLISLCIPLIVSVAGVRFLHEHITKREQIGIAIAIAGTVLTVLEPIVQNVQSNLRLSGNLLILGYVVVGTLATVIGKKLLQQDVKPSTLTNTTFIIGFITTLPFAILSGKTNITTISLNAHLSVFYMALFSGTVAYYLSNKAQKSIEVGEQALFSYLYPIFSIPLAVLWLGEKITPLFILGGIIIATGVFIAEIKNHKQ